MRYSVEKCGMIGSGHNSPCDMTKLFEISFDLLVTAGVDGRFEVLNPAWEKILGWKPEQLLGKPYLSFVHPDDVARTLRETERVLHGEPSPSFHNRYLCADGSYRWLLWTAVVKDGYFHASGRDITELKEQAQLLRETNEMGQIGGWNFEPETKKVSLSDQAYHLFGLREDTPLDWETMLCFILEPGRARLRDAARIALDNGQDFEIELEFTSLKGRRGWIRVKGRAEIRDQQCRRIYGLIQDITEKKATELRLQHEQSRMLQASKMAALGEMAGSIAHEINTPLGVITLRAGQLERILAAGAADPSETVNIARVIGNTAEKIASIIRGLRAFARSGEQDPFEIKALEAIIEETASFCSSTFVNAGIQLKIDAVPAGLGLECRPVQIVQVLLNLLSNSKSAVECASEARPAWVRISCYDQGDAVAIHVLDSGLGVPQEIRGRVMEPFFTTKKVGEGTGLGLSISKGIVEDHHGALMLKEDEPHTCFVVTIPKSQPQTPRRRRRPSMIGEASNYSST